MANEIGTDQPGLTGSTLYAIVLDGSGLAWNGTAFAAVSSGSWSTYAIALTEATGTGVFLGTFPAGIVAAGRYGVSVRRRVGGSPATSDPVVAAGSIDWSGTAPAVPSGSDPQAVADLVIAGIGGVADGLIGVRVVAMADGVITEASIAPETILTPGSIRDAIGLATANLDAQLAAVGTPASISDKLLGRNVAGGSDGGRTVKQALYALRNRVDIATGHVYEIDDATISWSFATTTDPAAEPITAIDPT